MDEFEGKVRAGEREERGVGGGRRYLKNLVKEWACSRIR
jgi:hypothetical protein